MTTPGIHAAAADRTRGNTMNASLRRAVLQLATVHAGDRRWVLAQLPAAQRNVIAQLLKEVRALGIRDARPWLAALDARAVQGQSQQGADFTAKNTRRQITQHGTGIHDGPHSGNPSESAAVWARWLLAQDEPASLSFDERVTLETLAALESSAGLAAVAHSTRLPPAWRPVLIGALRETLR